MNTIAFRITKRPLLAALAAATLAPAAVVPAAASAAQSAPVTGTQTAVAPDAGLVGALTKLGVKVRGTGASTVDGQGRFVFPVTGGSLTPELKGRVNHTGGLEFRTAYGLKFGIGSFTIDLTGAPTLTAIPTVANVPLGIRVPVATIGDITPTTSGGATTVTGTLKLTGIGALYVNLFVGKPAVNAGTLFGTATSTITLGTPAG